MTTHTCTAEEFDHTPAHVRVANCPRCAELREHYAEPQPQVWCAEHGPTCPHGCIRT